MAQPASFHYPDFNSTAGLGLQGPAKSVDNRLQLSPAGSNRSGAVWLSSRWFVVGGFETVFRFQAVNASGSTGPAEGFAFVIQSDALPVLGETGPGLGYEGLPKSLAVEFDWRHSADRHDPANPHVSVQAQMLLPNSADHVQPLLKATAEIPAIADGTVHTAKIQYANETIQVFIDDFTNPLLSVPLSHEQGFKEIIGSEDGLAWVGFTAPASAAGCYPEILNWAFTNSPSALSVQLAIPSDGASYLTPGPVQLEAGINSTTSVERVVFFQNGAKLGECTENPYSLRWANVPPGDYTLTAAATDIAGNYNVSTPARVTVLADIPPVGINFASAQNEASHPVGSMDLAGVLPQRFWNNLSSASTNGTATNLRNGIGMQTSLDVSWTSPGCTLESEVNSDNSPDYALMQAGLLVAEKTSNTVIRVQQAGYEVYDVIVYSDGPNGNADVEMEFRIDDQTRLLRDPAGNRYAGSFSEARTTAEQAEALAGNYVRFNGLTNSSFTLLATARAGSNSVAGAAVNAIQIIPSINVSAAIQLVRGPYLQACSTTNIVVRWRTNRRTSTQVRLGVSPTQMTQVAEDPAMTTEHIIRLENLQPGTRYYYAVGTADSDLAGGDLQHTFVTNPTQYSRPSRICVTSDTQTGNATQRAVRDAFAAFLEDNTVDQWLSLGDTGGNIGSDPDYQYNFFDMYPTMLRNLPVWPTLGNHDTYTLTPEGEPYSLRFWSRPTNAECGGFPSGSNRYYSFDYANIHFVCLDSASSDRSVDGPMYRWLAQDLAAQDKTWLIVYFHHTPYTKGSHDSDNDSEYEIFQMRANFVPLLEASGADLVLCGHSHVYERTYMLNGHYGLSSTFTPAMIKDPGLNNIYTKAANRPRAHQGTVYVTAGISGEARGGTLNHPAMALSTNILGFLVLDIDETTLNVRVLNENGQTADQFTIGKQIVVEGYRITSLHVNQLTATLTWQSEPGKTYEVLWKPLLNSPDWQLVGSNIAGTGSTTSWSHSLESGSPTGFYRVQNR